MAIRKRIVIAVSTALAVIGVGVTVYVLSRPKPGTVEWHKKRCQQLYAECEGRTLRFRMHHLCHRWTGIELIKPSKDSLQKAYNELSESREKLIELGFLIRRGYVFTNLPADSLSEKLLAPEINRWRSSIRPEHRAFCWVNIGSVYTSHSEWFERAILFVVAPREDQPDWEAVVRKMDAPESAKPE